MESLAITPPQKCIQVIDDCIGSDIKDIMKKDSQSQGWIWLDTGHLVTQHMASRDP